MKTTCEEAWLKSQAYAAYGQQEDVRDTFYMGWNAGFDDADHVPPTGELVDRVHATLLQTQVQHLTARVGNMVCAKRQMDEELEIARDDLLMFKGALSALGEASKKLVVYARTTGGTVGPDQGLMDACEGVEAVITIGGVALAMVEFERITAERDALQLRLNAAYQRADDLETELAKTKRGYEWESSRAEMLLAELQDLEDRSGSLQPSLKENQDIPGTSFQRLNQLANEGE